MNNDNFVGNTKSATDILGNVWNYDCMGCAINRGDLIPPGGIIYEGKYVILTADTEVPIPGFLIINIKRHVNSFSELEKEERIEVVNLLTHAEKAIKKLGIGKYVFVIQEETSSHLHIWIFPYSDEMKKKYGKDSSHLREIMKECIKNSNDDTIKEVLDVVERVKIYFKENDINK